MGCDKLSASHFRPRARVPTRFNRARLSLPADLHPGRAPSGANPGALQPRGARCARLSCIGTRSLRLVFMKQRLSSARACLRAYWLRPLPDIVAGAQRRDMRKALSTALFDGRLTVCQRTSKCGQCGTSWDSLHPSVASSGPQDGLALRASGEYPQSGHVHSESAPRPIRALPVFAMARRVLGENESRGANIRITCAGPSVSYGPHNSSVSNAVRLEAHAYPVEDVGMDRERDVERMRCGLPAPSDDLPA
jgi:hypothetical protein